METGLFADCLHANRPCTQATGRQTSHQPLLPTPAANSLLRSRGRERSVCRLFACWPGSMGGLTGTAAAMGGVHGEGQRGWYHPLPSLPLPAPPPKFLDIGLFWIFPFLVYFISYCFFQGAGSSENDHATRPAPCYIRKEGCRFQAGADV